MCMRLFLAIVTAGCVIASACIAADAMKSVPVLQSSEYVKANVYFYGWGYISDSTKTITDTRNEHSEYLEISKPILMRDFVSWLRLDQLTSESVVEDHHALLVIDLVKANGISDTYYSDGCKLYSADSKHSRPIDSDFRKQFDFVGSEMVMHTPKRDYDLCGG